ncbi:MAG: bifunctional folylpolyglutamate synthase/dihydrofolate synthase, partial [Planctomycetota bacterium]
MRTVDEALRALSRLTNYERTRADGPRAFDLSRPAGLLERLGAPHRRLGGRVVQVAGTKGKGSTARFVDGIFRAAGLRTGRFLSPHLESVRERIAVDGAPIEEAAFAAHVEQVLDAVDGETTFFEALLAAACLHFAEHRIDAAVLEVGLGGRLDATTAVPATHTIITEISFDHTEILGTSLEEIAAEKAGTIRRGVPVWSGVDPQSAAGGVIAAIARERQAP